MLLHVLAKVDPKLALHETWKAASPEVHLGTSGAGFTAWLAGLDRIAVMAFFATAIPLVWGVVVQCWAQYRVALIKLKEAQVDSDDRIARRRAAEATRPYPPPTDGLFVLAPDTRPSG